MCAYWSPQRLVGLPQGDYWLSFRKKGQCVFRDPSVSWDVGANWASTMIRAHPVFHLGTAAGSRSSAD